MPSPTSQPEQPSRSISLVTLVIASASSVVAAIVVSRIWGPGTLIGAAVTPVIVTLVSEALKKPAEVITVVRPASDRARQRAQPRRREVAPDDLQAGDTVVATPPPAARTRRPALVAAVLAGLLAFAIGAFVLTSTELVFGDAASGGGSTTYFSGGGDSGSPRTTPADEEPDAPVTTSTETQTTTTTVPATPTAPPATETAPEETTPVPAPGGVTGATGVTTP